MSYIIITIKNYRYTLKHGSFQWNSLAASTTYTCIRSEASILTGNFLEVLILLIMLHYLCSFLSYLFFKNAIFLCSFFISSTAKRVELNIIISCCYTFHSIVS